MSALFGCRGRKLTAAAVGGVAGLAAMQLVLKLVSPLVRPRAREGTDVFATERSMSPLGAHHRPEENATAALGRLAFAKLLGREPSSRLGTVLSWGVHIGFGLAAATAFGFFRGARTRHPIRDGLLFGAGLWLAGDELVVPLLGLADKPTAYSVTQHAQALAAHLGFGVASTVTSHYVERAL